MLSNQWKRRNKITNRVKFDVDKLKDENILNKFQLGINDALNATRYEKELEVQTGWELIKNSVLEVADAIIKQPSRPKTKHWFNKKCADVINLRNDYRLKMIQHQTQSNKDILEKRRKETHKVIRQEKRKMEKGKVSIQP
jgi:hypothetical protein